MITFIGHVSKDLNVSKGRTEILAGGGVYYGSFAAKSLGEDVTVLTKLNLKDYQLFKDMEDFGIKLIWIESPLTTSIENIYPSDNPDDRISRIVSRADPFTENEIQNVSGVVHISPLWHGEFPEELIETVRKKAKILSGDAQGFLRNVDNDGNMYYKDWEHKNLLEVFDVFKVDSKEAKILTGEDDPELSLRKIVEFGVKEVLLTTKEGIYLYKFEKIYFHPFGEWTMEGRTGRGDTAIAAYLALRDKIENIEKLVKRVAEITTLKMKRRGPYRGWMI